MLQHLLFLCFFSMLRTQFHFPYVRERIICLLLCFLKWRIAGFSQSWLLSYYKFALLPVCSLSGVKLLAALLCSIKCTQGVIQLCRTGGGDEGKLGHLPLCWRSSKSTLSSSPAASWCVICVFAQLCRMQDLRWVHFFEEHYLIVKSGLDMKNVTVWTGGADQLHCLCAEVFYK